MLSFTTSNAQVGVNYAPQKGDIINSPLVITKKEKDALRFKHNNQPTNVGDVLISDIDGNVRYGVLTATKIEFINGIFKDNQARTGLFLNDVYNEQLKVHYTNANITLPPGRWAVNFSLNFEVLRNKVIQTAEYSNISHRTESRLSSNEFYNQSFKLYRSGETTRFNPNTDKVDGTNCVGNKCLYFFTRSTLIRDQVVSAWGPIERDESIWARVILSDRATNRYPNDYNAESTNDRPIRNLYLASGALVGPAPSTMIKGEIYIENRGRTPKTYYLKVALQNVNLKNNRTANYKIDNFAAGPETNPSDRFFAVPAND